MLPLTPLRHGGLAGDLWTTFVPGVIALAGIGLAYLLYQRRRQQAAEADASAAARYFLGGWGFDWLYRYVFEVPFLWFAHASRNDLFEPPVDRLARLARAGWRGSVGHAERPRALVCVRDRPAASLVGPIVCCVAVLR